MPKRIDTSKKPEAGPKELVAKESAKPVPSAPPRAAIPADWDVPAVFRERFGRHFGSQRAMLAEGHLLLILHEVPIPGEHARTGQIYWRSPSGLWTTTASGEGLPALERLLDSYGEELDRLMRVLDRAQLGEDYFRALKAIHPVERAATNLYRALADAREGLRGAPEHKDVIHFRDRAGDNARRAELLREDARSTLDYQVAAQAAEQSDLNRKLNVTTQRLNILIALFFPLTAVSTVFGMNLAHGFEGGPFFYFWITVFASLGVGLLLAALVSKS